MELILINAKQVEWLVINQPETEHTTFFYEGEFQEHSEFHEIDIELSSEDKFDYYLTPNTYNSLPTEFKELR